MSNQPKATPVAITRHCFIRRMARRYRQCYENKLNVTRYNGGTGEVLDEVDGRSALPGVSENRRHYRSLSLSAQYLSRRHIVGAASAEIRINAPPSLFVAAKRHPANKTVTI